MNRIKVLLLPSTCTPLWLVQTLSAAHCVSDFTLRCACAAVLPGPTERGCNGERAAAGLGKVTYIQTGTDHAPGSHLSVAQSACKLEYAFTLFSAVHKGAWCVHRQLHPSYLKVKEGHSYTCAGLGIHANAASVHHYSSPVENGLEKGDNSLGCSLLLFGAIKLLALMYQLQGKKYLWILFCSTKNLV